MRIINKEAVHVGEHYGAARGDVWLDTDCAVVERAIDAWDESRAVAIEICGRLFRESPCAIAGDYADWFVEWIAETSCDVFEDGWGPVEQERVDRLADDFVGQLTFHIQNMNDSHAG